MHKDLIHGDGGTTFIGIEDTTEIGDGGTTFIEGWGGDISW